MGCCHITVISLLDSDVGFLSQNPKDNYRKILHLATCSVLSLIGSSSVIVSSNLFPPVALRPNTSHCLFILEISRSHTTTYHSPLDSTGCVISSSQRPLPDHTQHSQRTTMPRRDSNTQASGRRPTP